MRRIALGAIASTLLLGGCAVPALLPVSGRVVDSISKEPVPGAVVRYDRTASCFGGMESRVRYDLAPSEGVSDADGRFRIWPTAFFVPCLLPSWDFELTIVAPGYRPAYPRHREFPLSTKRRRLAGTFYLVPVRNRLELLEYRDVARHLAWRAKHGELLERTIASILTDEPHVTSSPGAFARVEGAHFVRIALAATGVVTENFPGIGTVSVARETILAQDKNGLLDAWFPNGDRVDGSPIKLPAYVRLVPGHNDYPRFATDTRIFFAANDRATIFNLFTDDWFSRPTRIGAPETMLTKGHWIFSLEGEHLLTYDLERYINWLVPRRKPGEPREVLDGPLEDSQGRLECAALLVVGGPRRVFAVGRGPHGRTLFFADETHGPKLQLKPIPIEQGELKGDVMSCAGGYGVGFLATRDGLQSLEFFQSKGGNWRARLGTPVSLASSGGPSTFVSIAANQSVVYAVAGGDTVYRFSRELEPDAMITVAPSH
jgi:hypothetical protein